ncbi:MAG: CIA30 family protein [Bacteroidota bacterium]
MKYIFLTLLMFSLSAPNIIYDFNEKSDLKNWQVVDDGVMGGRSSGSFKIDSQGHGVFGGFVSLENNGGFSSVRFGCEKKSVEEFENIILRIKGDGKNYQFRVKHKSRDYYSYVYDFATSGDWQEIQIPLNEMYPSFRGMKLDMPKFSNSMIEEIAFLIANKKEEQFKLRIDHIGLD